MELPYESLPREPVEWTSEQASAVEAHLRAIVEKIPGVMEPRGASNPDFRDYKVCFGREDSPELETYFLTWEPKKLQLKVSPAGLAYGVPAGIKHTISQLLPTATAITPMSEKSERYGAWVLES